MAKLSLIIQQTQCYLGRDKTSGLKFDHIEFPELVIRQGKKITFRSRIWNGVGFNSDDWTSFTGITAFRPQLSVTKNEVVYWDEVVSLEIDMSRFTMRDDGLLERYIWDTNIV